MTSAPAIGFEYRPSRWVARLFVFVACAAAFAVAVSGIPWMLRAATALIIFLACTRAVRRLRTPIYAVGWASQTGWSVRGLDGADDAAVLKSFRIFRQVALLRLISTRYGRLTLWLMPDNADPDTRRRLRMRLAVLRAAEDGGG